MNVNFQHMQNNVVNVKLTGILPV